jgi:hypothetical protein
MQKAQTISSLVLSPVKVIKVRQPLQVMIPVLDDNQVEIEAISDLKSRGKRERNRTFGMLQVF